MVRSSIYRFACKEFELSLQCFARIVFFFQEFENLGIYNQDPLFSLEELETNDFCYVSNIEQLNKIEKSKENIISIKEGLKNNTPIDLIEVDLKNIWQTLGEVIGETYTEELLDNLFKNFCVGK